MTEEIKPVSREAELVAAGIITPEQATKAILYLVDHTRKISLGEFKQFGGALKIDSTSKRWLAVVEPKGQGKVDRNFFTQVLTKGTKGPWNGPDEGTLFYWPLSIDGKAFVMEVGNDETRGKYRDRNRLHWAVIPTGDKLLLCVPCGTDFEQAELIVWKVRAMTPEQESKLPEIPKATQEISNCEEPDPENSHEGNELDLMGLLVGCEQAMAEEDWEAAHYLSRRLTSALMSAKLAERCRARREEIEREKEGKVA